MRLPSGRGGTERAGGSGLTATAAQNGTGRGDRLWIGQFGAGDRDRTGDIQLGKVYIAFIINNLQKQQSTKIDASGLKRILTAGAKKGFHPMNMRVSACSFATPFSTPLEHRETVRTARCRIPVPLWLALPVPGTRSQDPIAQES